MVNGQRRSTTWYNPASGKSASSAYFSYSRSGLYGVQMILDGSITRPRRARRLEVLLQQLRRRADHVLPFLIPAHAPPALSSPTRYLMNSPNELSDLHLRLSTQDAERTQPAPATAQQVRHARRARRPSPSRASTRTARANAAPRRHAPDEVEVLQR